MRLNFRYFYYFGFISLFLVSCIEDKTKQEHQIFQVLNDQTDAWNKGDIKGFMDGYERSDSLQFITRKGRTLGWQNVLDSYIKYYPTKKEMGKLHFKNMKIEPLSDNLAQAYGNWEVKSDTIYSGNFSLIMKNKPEGWKIIIDHTW